jgi:hypothetical protein
MLINDGSSAFIEGAAGARPRGPAARKSYTGTKTVRRARPKQYIH